MTLSPLKLRTYQAPRCTPEISPRNAFCTRLGEASGAGSIAAQSLPEVAAGKVASCPRIA